MDVLKKTDKKGSKLRYLIITSSIVIFFMFGRSFFASEASVYQADLDFGEVKKEAFTINVFANGMVEPKSSNIIVSLESGIISELRSYSGAFVKKGQILLTIENKELRDKLTDCKLELEKFISSSKVIKLELYEQKTRHDSEVNISKYELERAEYELTAKRKLIKMDNSAVSLLDLKSSQMSYNIAKSKLQSKQNILSSFEKKKNARIDEISFDLNEKKIRLSRLEYRVESLNVKASEDGIIQNLDFDVGEKVNTEQLIGKLIKSDNIQTVLKVSALDTSLISLNQSVEITIGDSKYQGSVSRISPIVEGSTVDISVEFDDIPKDLKINSFVNASISVFTKEDSLTIPRPYNLVENSTNSLFVLDKEEQKITLRKVQLGHASKSRVEVIRGLALGEKIVISDTSTKLFLDKEISIKS